jgi:hypothetical protein
VSTPPLWRQAFDTVERAVTPRAEELVRTPGFALGTALVRRAQGLARTGAQELTARAWHLLNLPAGTDVSRLRAQIGALDREVRRLTIQLEAERRRAAGSATRPTTARSSPRRPPEEPDGDGAQPADGARPRAPRRRAQRPPGP